jgi:probable rRNA maturation factor
MIFVEKIDKLDPDIAVSIIEIAARAALKHQSVTEESDLTIVLSDDNQLRDLNMQWMGVNAPTDVLSFPSDEIDPESGCRYLGDIIISVQRASEQAKAAGHAVESELQLLVVHGILHLMGHDHAEALEKTRMWLAQAEILGGLGLGSIEIRE